MKCLAFIGEKKILFDTNLFYCFLRVFEDNLKPGIWNVMFWSNASDAYEILTQRKSFEYIKEKYKIFAYCNVIDFNTHSIIFKPVKNNIAYNVSFTFVPLELYEIDRSLILKNLDLEIFHYKNIIITWIKVNGIGFLYEEFIKAVKYYISGKGKKLIEYNLSYKQIEAIKGIKTLEEAIDRFTFFKSEMVKKLKLSEIIKITLNKQIEVMKELIIFNKESDCNVIENVTNFVISKLKQFKY